MADVILSWGTPDAGTQTWGGGPDGPMAAAVGGVRPGPGSPRGDRGGLVGCLAAIVVCGNGIAGIGNSPLSCITPYTAGDIGATVTMVPLEFKNSTEGAGLGDQSVCFDRLAALVVRAVQRRVHREPLDEVQELPAAVAQGQAEVDVLAPDAAVVRTRAVDAFDAVEQRQ